MKLAPAPKTATGGRPLLLIVAVFTLPFALATTLFFAGWRPGAAKPHGELVAGNSPLPFAALRGADGRPLPDTLLAGHWTLVVADPGPCRADCQARLASVRRIHGALGKAVPRVRRVWLSPAPAADPALAAGRADPELIVAVPGDAAWAALIPVRGPRLLVIDPAGRPVIAYPEPFDPRAALRDVERLLKYSWIG